MRPSRGGAFHDVVRLVDGDGVITFFNGLLDCLDCLLHFVVFHTAVEFNVINIATISIFHNKLYCLLRCAIYCRHFFCSAGLHWQHFVAVRAAVSDFILIFVD